MATTQVPQARARRVALVLAGFAAGLFGGFLGSLLRGPDGRDVPGVKTGGRR